MIDSEKLREAIKCAWSPLIRGNSAVIPVQTFQTLRAAAEALLEEPRIPSPTDHAAIDALAQRAPTIPRQWIAEIIRIINEPPAPKTTTTQVWRVEWATRTGMGAAAVYMPQIASYPTERQAREVGAALASNPMAYCVNITGPHSQEVPIEVAPADDGCRGRTLAERRA